MAAKLIQRKNDLVFFYTCEPVIIGYNPENADMTYPNGEIWGREYQLHVETPNGIFSYIPRQGLRDAALSDVVEDFFAFFYIFDFHPSKCKGFTMGDFA